MKAETEEEKLIQKREVLSVLKPDLLKIPISGAI